MHQQGQYTHAADEVAPDRMLPVIRAKLERSSKPLDCVRRIQGNAKRAASAVSEIAQMIKYYPETPYSELAFLQRVATFFDSLSKSMEGEKKRAKIIERREKKASEAKLERDIKNSITGLFGQSQEAEVIRSMAADLITFNESVDDYLKAKYSVAFGMLPIACFCLAPELERAVADGDLSNITRCIALLHTEMKDKGRHWIGENGEAFYVAGWADFIEYCDGLRVTANASRE